MFGLFYLIIWLPVELSFPYTLFSVDRLVLLTVRNFNRSTVSGKILMRKSAGETGNGTLGVCSHDMESVETMGWVHSFSNFQLIFFFDDLSFFWPFHSPCSSPRDGKQDIFTKTLFLWGPHDLSLAKLSFPNPTTQVPCGLLAGISLDRWGFPPLLYSKGMIKNPVKF